MPSEVSLTSEVLDSLKRQTGLVHLWGMVTKRLQIIQSYAVYNIYENLSPRGIIRTYHKE